MKRVQVNLSSVIVLNSISMRFRLVLCLFAKGLYSYLTDWFIKLRQLALKLPRTLFLSGYSVPGMLDIVAHYFYFGSKRSFPRRGIFLIVAEQSMCSLFQK
jgi:hypothetical protein